MNPYICENSYNCTTSCKKKKKSFLLYNNFETKAQVPPLSTKGQDREDII